MRNQRTVKRSRRGKIVPRLVTIVVLGLSAAPAARAQVAVAAPPAPPTPAAPAEPAPPEVAPPAAPAEPGYGPYGQGYGPPAPYYYYHHRYRPMPYYPYAQYSPYAYQYAYPPPYAPPPGFVPGAVMVDRSPGFHTHDGFYMRVHAGIASTSLSSTSGGTKQSYTGGGSSFGIAMGGVICRNLILYGTIFGTDTANVDFQNGGVSVSGPVGRISTAAVGPGMTYYFEHLNLYVSAAFGLAGYAMYGVNDNSQKLEWSRTGSALELMVGKEWWVSRDWGLGIAGEIIGASYKDGVNPGWIWSGGSAAVLFSATYN
jgi:hypothetical protein